MPTMLSEATSTLPVCAQLSIYACADIQHRTDAWPEQGVAGHPKILTVTACHQHSGRGEWGSGGVVVSEGKKKWRDKMLSYWKLRR